MGPIPKNPAWAGRCAFPMGIAGAGIHLSRRLALKFLRLRRRPRFEFVQIGHVELQYHVNAVVAMIERQPDFVRSACGLLDGDVNLDPAIVVQHHTPVLPHAVLLQVIGNEETILSVVEGERSEGSGGGHNLCWHAVDIIMAGIHRFTVRRHNGWIDSFAHRRLVLKPNFSERGRLLIGHYIKFPDITERLTEGLNGYFNAQFFGEKGPMLT